MMESFDPGEGRPRGNAVHQDEPLAISNPLVPQRSVLLLAGCVENLKHACLPVYDDLFAVRILDRGVILKGEKGLDWLIIDFGDIERVMGIHGPETPYGGNRQSKGCIRQS